MLEQRTETPTHHVPAAALAAQALTAHAPITSGDRSHKSCRGDEAWPEARHPEVDRVLQVLDSREGVPGHLLEEPAAEQHAVAHQTGWQTQGGATSQTNSVEEQKRGRDQSGRDGGI